MRNTKNDTTRNLETKRTRTSLLRPFMVSLVGLAFLLLPQAARADFTATLSGNTVTFTGDSTSATLILGQEDGMLTHNCYAKGKAGFNSSKDLDSTQPGDQTLSLAQIEKIIINGGSGDDTLIINNPAGSLFAPNAVIEFNGGDGNDTLVIQGGGGPAFRETYTPGPTKDAGVIETTNGVACQVINFSGLEPVTDNVPAGTLTVNGTNADNSINYVKGPGGGIFVGNTGLVSVDNMETFEFNNKTNLVINSLAGSDTINLNYNNTSNPAGLTGTITVNGGDPSASDTLIVNGIAGVLDNLRYRPTSVGAGTVINDNEPQPDVLFTGIEHLKEVVQQADGDGVRIDGTTGNDAIEFFHGVTSDQGQFVGTMDQNNATGVGPFTMTEMSFTGASPLANDADVNFFNPGGTDSFVFNGTSNDDNITIQGGEAGGTEFRNTLNGIVVSRVEVFNVASTIARGLDGNDTINVSLPAGPAAVTVRAEGGLGTDTVNYVPPTDVPTTIDLLAGTINSTGANPFTFTGIEQVNETSSGVSSAITIQGSAGPQTFVYSPTATTGVGTLSGFGPSVSFTGVRSLVTFNGGDPAASDTVIVSGVPGALDNLRYLPTNAGAGTVIDDNQPHPNLLFTGAAHLTLAIQQADGDGVRVDGTTGNDAIEFFHGVTSDQGLFVGTMDQNNATGVGPFTMTPMNFIGAFPLANDADVNFFNPGGTDSFVYNGTPNDDNIQIGPGEAGGTEFRNTLNGIVVSRVEVFNVASCTARGLDGDDTFNVNLPAGPIAAALRVEGGLGNDTLNYNPPTNVATTIDYGASSIASTGANPLTFGGTETINETSSGAAPTLTINGTSGGDNLSFNPTGTKAGSVTLAGAFPLIKFTGLATLTLNGLDGNDFFNITPSSTVTVNVNGGNPIPPASPGDSIVVNTAGTTGFSLSNTSTVTGLMGSFTFSNRMPVNFQQIETLSPLVVSPTTINVIEGVPFNNQVVAKFSASAIPISNFTATINWGDGTASSSGAISSTGLGTFNVAGSHTYLEEGTRDILVTVTDLTTSTAQTVTSKAFVADAPLSIVPLSAGSATTFSGVGGNNSSVTAGTANAALNAFKTAIGGPDNGATPSPQANGFRSINWDGVALDGTDFGGATTTIVPNFVVGIPVNRFQERGINFEEVYAVSGPASGVDPSTFTTVNAGVANQFPGFSPTKTFAMFNDNTIDFKFVLPSNHSGPPVQAVSRGFGAIFVDVETPNTTSVEYFSGTTSLGKFFVPVGTTGQAEFFGVLFQNPAITNVEITLGNATLFSFDGVNVTSGPADNPGGGTDLAVTDDFAYAEPTAVSTGININATAGAPFTAKVASFTDADPNGQVSDYSVVINWGDGTTSAGGVTPNAASSDSSLPDSMAVSITPSINGGFDVTGTHTYAAAGAYVITTSIRDAGGASISGTATAAVAGAPSLSINNVTVTEGDSGTVAATFTVTLSAAITVPVTVDYFTSDGTAKAIGDYQPVNGTLTFSPGQTTKTITVPVVGDTVPESTESFFVNLMNPTNATIAIAQGTGTIIDNDASPALAINNVTVTEPPNGSVPAIFTVTLSAASTQPVTVDYFTSDNTATAPEDYQAVNGTLTFSPGQTTRTITVPVAADTAPGNNETFFVNLQNPTGATISTPQGVGTITENDTGGVLQFSATNYSVDENNPRVDITVTRSGNTAGAASVGFATSDTAGLQNCNVFNGIASSRCDYETTIGTLQFDPGQTSRSFSVAIVNDSYAEGNESFTVSLSNPAGAVLGSPSTATVTIVDNESTTLPNPIDSTDFFVRQHYLDFLGREPDPPGFGAWVSLINGCAPGNATCDRIHVSQAFFESEEFQQRGYFIYRFYSVSLGRKPTYAEFAPDFSRVSGFLDVNQLEAAKVAFIADFMARPAFAATYNPLTNTQFVDTLLSTAGVTLPAPVRQALIDGLNGATLTRAQVLRQIVERTEVAQKFFNEAYAVMEYFGYLRRDPDAFYLSWVTLLNSGASSRTMVGGFINSQEYRARFGP